MKKIRRVLVYSAALVAVVVSLGIGGGYWFLHGSMPVLDGEVELAGLVEPVKIDSGKFGIPAVHAENRIDAMRALGYVTARDRLFQMDLMRRKTAGRLAEIFGEFAIGNDIRARTFGFNRVAKAVVSKLPERHKSYLDAYAQGVNSYIDQSSALAFEFSVLGYRPEPWQAEDSILVMLGMFDTLTAWSEREERMLSVMAKTLTPELVAFLTPDTDRFTDRLSNFRESLRPAQRIPVASMAAALKRHAPDALRLAETVQLRDSVSGSNAWAVSGKQTQDGRAILANDMHLGITVPNIWYRIEINYGGTHVAGVMLPGIPITVAGSNRHLAWGATNLSGDFLDLVGLEINPDDPDQYKLAGRWQRFEEFTESIAVKRGNTRNIKVRQTVWGPVSTDMLMGRPVAVHWTALDSDAVNFELVELEQSKTLEQALPIINRTGGPQLNILLADDTGRIAWTLMGKVPKRFGGDGSISRPWTDGSTGWSGYVAPEDLPRRIDPPEGFLVSANDRRFDKDYPYIIGRQFASGYRAYRITQQLKQIESFTETSMFGLQLDNESRFFDFYRQLALAVLTPDAIERAPELAELRGYIHTWNGRADSDSLGFALLVEFRKRLAKSVLEPFLAACRGADANFNYSWTYIDTPLQSLLTEKPEELLPDSKNYRDWNAFILGQLKISLQQLKTSHPELELSDLTWGRINKAQFKHPFSRVFPLLGFLLDMPQDELAGCSFCVRVAGPEFGASERLVVSPGHLEDGILHMPGGQSSHPLSPHYRDQQRYWVDGSPLPLQAGEFESTLVLKPRVASGKQ